MVVVLPVKAPAMPHQILAAPVDFPVTRMIAAAGADDAAMMADMDSLMATPMP